MHTLCVREAKTFWKATIGLIGAKKAYPLLLRTRFGIHTFGVSFPIDVVILDSSFHIVRMKKSLLPNHVYFWPPQWSIVLELPKGTIDHTNLQRGDELHLLFA